MPTIHTIELVKIDAAVEFAEYSSPRATITNSSKDDRRSKEDPSVNSEELAQNLKNSASGSLAPKTNTVKRSTNQNRRRSSRSRNGTGTRRRNGSTNGNRGRNGGGGSGGGSGGSSY